MEQKEKTKAIIATESALDSADTVRADLTGNNMPPISPWLTRLFVAEWDAIAGLIAAVIAVTIHWLHLGPQVDLLSIAVGLLALLFLRSLRRERRTKHAFDEVHKCLVLLQSIETKQVTPRHLKTHNLCFQIDQIERNLGNPLFNTKWEETRENIDNLAQGRIIVRNRADIFTYKAKGLKNLSKDEEFRSTVIPTDLDYPTYEDNHFEHYQEEIFEFAARVRNERGRARRLYIFRDQEQFDELNHKKHMQLMADYDVEVGYLILSHNVENKNKRDLIAHKDYAIFGARFYARYDTDKHRSVIETDRHQIDEAIKDFDLLWKMVGNQVFYRRKTGA